MVAEVTLPEYENKTAIIPFSEFSRRRVRSMNKTAKIGQRQPCLVTKVDANKGYIDVSKSKLNNNELKLCERKYIRGQKTINLIKEFYLDHFKPHVFDKNFFEDLCERTIWSLDKIENKKGSSYEYLKKALNDSSIFEKWCNLSPEEHEGLMKIVVAKLSPKEVKMRAEIEVQSLRGGVKDIVESLVDAKNSTEDPNEIKIMIVSPPKYFVECSGIDTAILREKIDKVLKQASENILSRNGTFSNKEPKIIGAEEDKLLDIDNVENDDDISDRQTDDDDEECNEEMDEEDEDCEESSGLSDESSSIG
ncbi:MAG: Eukaryotic translation initiation factor 2 subunit 1 [Paramarteilia canceri]